MGEVYPLNLPKGRPSQQLVLNSSSEYMASAIEHKNSKIPFDNDGMFAGATQLYLNWLKTFVVI